MLPEIGLRSADVVSECKRLRGTAGNMPEMGGRREQGVGPEESNGRRLELVDGLCRDGETHYAIYKATGEGRLFTATVHWNSQDQLFYIDVQDADRLHSRF